MLKNRVYAFTIPVEEQYFSNKNHLINFEKYLFSMSNSHKESNETKNNLYFTNIPINTQHTFNINPNTNIKSYRSKTREDRKNHEDLTMDLHYIYFVAIYNGKMITNMLEEFEHEGKMVIGNGIYPDFEDEIYSRFKKNKELYFDWFDGIIEKVGQENVVLFSNRKEEERVFIERKLHKNLYKNFTPFNKKILISISHNDQDLYHIHRILKEIYSN